jgi:voltage-gated sodium channel
MAGVALLGEEMPERFGDIGAASLTLFVMLSLENFPDVLYAGTEVTPWALPFFLSYAVVAAFIVFNLLIGVVIASLEEAREEDAEPGVELADLQNQLNQIQTSIDSVLYNKRYGFRHQAKTPHRKEVKL